MTENYARGAFNLVVEKFAEILHINFALVGVDHRGERIDFAVRKVRPFNRPDDVRKLAHARRLD